MCSTPHTHRQSFTPHHPSPHQHFSTLGPQITLSFLPLPALPLLPITGSLSPHHFLLLSLLPFLPSPPPPQERSEARARGHFAVKRRPANAPPPPQQPASGLFWPSGASVAAMAGPRDSAPPHEDPFAASAHHHNAKLSQKQSSAYLGVVRRK